MSRLATFSMAGIGIAAALGFVFALSLVNNNTQIETDSDLIQRSTEPSSLLLQQGVEDSRASLSADSSQDLAAKRAEPDENETFSGGESASMMQPMKTTSLRPTLTSIIASDGNTGEIIGEVMPGMQFEAGKALFIKAKLVNLNDAQLSGHIVALGLSSDQKAGQNSTNEPTEHQSYEEATSFHGDIAPQGNVELELFWNPARTADYTLFLFSIAPDDKASESEPVASIPIKVVDKAGS